MVEYSLKEVSTARRGRGPIDRIGNFVAWWAAIGTVLIVVCSTPLKAQPRIDYRVVARQYEAVPGMPDHQFQRLGHGQVSFGRLLLTGSIREFIPEGSEGPFPESFSVIFQYQRGQFRRDRIREMALPVGLSNAVLFHLDGVRLAYDDSTIIYGHWAAPSGATGYGIWRRNEGGRMVPILWTGPGGFDEIWRGSLAVNRTGGCAFVATKTVDGVSRRGLWRFHQGLLQELVWENQPFPAAGPGAQVLGLTVTEPKQLAMNDHGEVAFIGGVSVAGQSLRSYFFYGEEGLQPVAIEGRPVSDEDPNFLFASDTSARVFIHPPGLNNRGQVVFASHVSGPGIDAANDSGIWVGRPGELQEVVREGDLIPGGDGDVFFDLLDPGRGSPAISGDGTIVFFHRFRSGVVNPVFRGGYFRGKPGNLSRIFADGDPAPGFSDGRTLFTWGHARTPFMNEQGIVVMFANLSSRPTEQSLSNGLWASFPDGTLVPVVVPGQDLPGAVLGGIARGVQLYVDGSGGEQGWWSPLDEEGNLVFQTEVNQTQVIVMAKLRPDASKPIAGDFNQDGTRDILDIVELNDELKRGPAGGGRAFDVNGDGVVDRFDREALISRSVRNPSGN